ncbi:helix-turn-helix transcriptional regulator [Nodosilinea sp. FACHB-13]|nr:helix-turn-helix transcriptional regulator [Nodosilinea sp. FACHB-13]
MPMRNKVSEFLAAHGLTAYQLIKDTGIAPATGYKLAKDESHLPSIRVLEVLCDRYQVQPSEFIEWVDGEVG